MDWLRLAGQKEDIDEKAIRKAAREDKSFPAAGQAIQSQFMKPK